MQKFIHLNVQTDHSIFKSTATLKQLVKKTEEEKMLTFGIADDGNLYGAIEYYQALTNIKKKPIIGSTFNIHDDEDISKRTIPTYKITLIAKDHEGYQNLLYLSSMSYIKGFYRIPRINKKILKERIKGVICILTFKTSEYIEQIKDENGRETFKVNQESLKFYQELFKDDLYLELRRSDYSDKFIEKEVRNISLSHNIKLVATNSVIYMTKNDQSAHTVYEKIDSNFDYKTSIIEGLKENRHFATEEEMINLFYDVPQAIDNTIEIYNKVDIKIEIGNPIPPDFKFVKEYAEADGVPELDNDVDYFTYKCEEGLKKRLEHIPKNKHKEYKDRLKFEMDIIIGMKFPGYMLMVWDFIREARKRKIPCGPGRGSAAGSLVAYALEITNINPMPYNLLFERFLNPERVSMPDIDMDFCKERRSEIIAYTVSKYGRFNVAQIITFGKLLAKGVIRDVSRVFHLPTKDADYFAKLIPNELNITLKDAEANSPELRTHIYSDSERQKIWEYALQLEGKIRNVGVHAGGVVASNHEIWEKSPFYVSPENEDSFVTQYSLNYLEDVDLIKFDFLGLKTLTVIDKALKMIKKDYNVEIDIDNLDFEDPEVYKMLQTGNTHGIFQIESDGMRQLIQRIVPTNFEDLIAILALYRPGPMESGMLDDYIEMKHGRKEIQYLFPELEESLKPTYGNIVYQEQVMEIVRRIGGFSLGESDVIRRAMGKKKEDLMAKYKAEFADGAEKQNFNRKKAEDLFDLIAKFAKYGFNKSHSAAYAMVTFQTAYLKKYYPAQFMAALMSYDMDNHDKLPSYIKESERLGLVVKNPNINESFLQFTTKKDRNGKVDILFGLEAIKGTGEIALNILIEEREENGLFLNIGDFARRIKSSKINKGVIESLAYAGAFDEFENMNRRTIIFNTENLLSYATKYNTILESFHYSIFHENFNEIELKLKIEKTKEFADMKKLNEEKKVIGMYKTLSPMDAFKDIIPPESEVFKIADIKRIVTEDYIKMHGADSSYVPQGGQPTKFVKLEAYGMITKLEKKFSKKGNEFALLSFADETDEIKVICFGRLVQVLSLLNRNKPISVAIDVSFNQGYFNGKLAGIKDLTEGRISLYSDN